MNCYKCGQLMTCNLSNNCWCKSFPLLKNFDFRQSCYCKECLIEALSKEINEAQYVDQVQKEKIARLGIPKALKENVDYTINEQGLYIFTSWYLMRRGYCCDNGCSHCPY